MASAQSSNKAIYWVIGVVVLAIVLFGGYKLWHHFSKGSAMQYTNNATTSQNNTVIQSPSQNSQSTGNSGLPDKTNTSNQQLDQDVQNIQNSMNQLQQDQGTTNQDTNNRSQDTPQQ